MKVGCYTLDLYCDTPLDKYPAGHLYEGQTRPQCKAPYGTQFQITGRTETECLRKARTLGWNLGKKHICPWCRELSK